MSQIPAEDKIKETSAFADSLHELLSETPDRWDKILTTIEEFKSYFVGNQIHPLTPVECRRSGYDHDLDISHSKSGVYLLFNKDERLLYVGWTRNLVKDRVLDHAKRFDWSILDIIPIEEDMHWLGCALERFLIDRVIPPPLFNKN